MGDNDRREILFMAMDAAIRSAGRASRNAVHELVIDCHWTTIERALAGRLINERLISAKAGRWRAASDARRLRRHEAGG
jgi:hypothetical protein